MKRVDAGCLRTGPEGLTSEATTMNMNHLAQGRIQLYPTEIRPRRVKNLANKIGQLAKRLFLLAIMSSNPKPESPEDSR